MKSIAEYSYIIANLRAKISNILDLDFFLKCAELKDLDSLLMQFKDSEFEFLHETYHLTGDLKTCEKKLRENELYYNSYIYRRTTGAIQTFCRALAVEYEIELLKELLRLWFDRAVRGQNISKLTPYLNRELIVHPIPVDPILNTDKFEDICELLVGTPYHKVLLAAAPKVNDTDTIYPAEIALDNYAYQSMFESTLALDRVDREIAQNYIGTLVDLENLNRIVRLEAYYQYHAKQIVAELIPGGKRLSLKNPILHAGEKIDVNAIFQSLFSNYFSSEEQSFATQEKLQQVARIDYQLKEAQARKALVGDPFSIGIIIAFIIRKKVEIQRATTIINAKYYQLSYERVKELL